ncbi:hypothetical protein PHACT_06000 [Pseudohongiella acticola]|uniref:Uncharacterized protein n=1 Tax=Pseudohongiella acticola TaxID=1524254 RepID=A0A1E8CK08_9GAMM|nr:hypothetical protein PHACT_06000 [Pseudohongiella acticola]
MELYAPELLVEMAAAIEKCPACRKYVKVGNNETVVLKISYNKRDDAPGTEPRPVDAGWITYLIKKLRMTTRLRLGSQVVSISNDLRAQIDWEISSEGYLH